VQTLLFLFALAFGFAFAFALGLGSLKLLLSGMTLMRSLGSDDGLSSQTTVYRHEETRATI
jgi:hypothetical protein